jgi:hypothetical protein
MAFTKEDLDAINEAIASGEQSIEHGDRKAGFRPIEELKAAKEHILANLSEEELSGLGIVRKRKRRPRAFRMNVGKGI